MSQPIRLRDGADPELRELMRYTQAQGAPSSARVDALTARVLAELSAPPAAPTSASSGSGIAVRALRFTFLQCAIGVALILALGLAAYQLHEGAAREPRTRTRTVPTALPVPAPQATAGAPASAREVAPVPRAVLPQAVEPQAERTVPRSRPRLRARSSERGGATPSTLAKPADLTAEMTLLQRARRVLASDPNAALALLAQHQREHTKGVFAEEREALAVEALWRAGNDEQAAQRFRALLAAYPRSTYRERLTTLLARPR